MTIEEAEILWRLGRLTVAQLRASAIETVAEGHDTPALYDLADGGYGTRAEADELFGRALAELGRVPISEQDAGIRVARGIAARIVAGDLAPIAGATELWRHLWSQSGKPWALERISGLAAVAAYDPSAMSLEVTNEEIVRAAQDLLDRTA